MTVRTCRRCGHPLLRTRNWGYVHTAAGIRACHTTSGKELPVTDNIARLVRNGHTIPIGGQVPLTKTRDSYTVQEIIPPSGEGDHGIVVAIAPWGESRRFSPAEFGAYISTD